MQWIQASKLKDIQYGKTYFAMWPSGTVINSTGRFQESDGTFFWNESGYMPIAKKEYQQLLILDESESPTPLSVEEAAEKYARANCWGCKTLQSQNPCTCSSLEAAFEAGAAHREKQADNAQLEYYPTGGINKDIVGDFFYAHKVEGATAEVQEFKNSDTRLSLMLVDNRVKAYVIETRTAFNNVMFVKGVVGNSRPTPIPSDIVKQLEAANPYEYGDSTEGAYNLGYESCLSKLRELLSSLPQNQKGEHKCMRCTSEYNIDLIIPDDLWLKISPKPVDGFKSGGLLCGSCIMQILEKELGQAFVLHASTIPAAPVDVLLNALNKITNPIKHMREDLKEGEQLHGQYAIQLSNDPEYLKSIARAALQEFNSGNQTEKDGWIKVDGKNYPPNNLGVLVLIPDEDYHVTSGMWDISEKWVLLDEYRVPECEVAYWYHTPELPDEIRKEVEENNKIMRGLKYLMDNKSTDK